MSIQANVAGLDEPTGPFSHVAKVGDLLFVSGFVSDDADGKVIHPDDAGLQTRVICEKLAIVLKSYGATFDDVAKVTIYVTDIRDRAAIAQSRRDFFGSSRPASTLVEITALAVTGAKVEIEAVVALQSATPQSH